jgi:hypothetical protein
MFFFVAFASLWLNPLWLRPKAALGFLLLPVSYIVLRFAVPPRYDIPKRPEHHGEPSEKSHDEKDCRKAKNDGYHHGTRAG